MDYSWQNLAIIPLVAGAVFYVAWHLKHRKSKQSVCDGCQPEGSCGDCPLAKAYAEKNEELNKL